MADLPEVPEAVAAARQLSATGQYKFCEGDVYATALASTTSTQLTLQDDGFAYAILGANSGGTAPSSLDLTGSCTGMYIGISDYSRNSWHWLGGSRSTTGVITLPEGEWCNSNGSFYVALICPDGAYGQIDLRFSVEPTVGWNLLVWLSGDNDLAVDAVSDINEMESTGSTENVRVLAGYDIDPSYLVETVSGTATVNFIKVVSDADSQSINTTGDAANLSFPRAGYNSADPANLAAFLDWAGTNFPAEHTMLVLWDHGDGWLPGASYPKGPSAVLYDESDGDNDLTDNTELASMLADYDIDILGFDACNMGQLEALYEYRGLAEYYIASQANEPNAGWDYAGLLSHWNSSYPLNANEICETTVTGFTDYYGSSGDDAVLAAYTNTGLLSITSALCSLAADVKNAATAESTHVKNAMNQAFEPDWGDGARDLEGFLTSYRSGTSDTGIQAKIDDALTALDSAVMCCGESGMSGCHGLCVWLPSMMYFRPGYKQKYGNLAFDEATGWLDMLNATGVPGGWF